MMGDDHEEEILRELLADTPLGTPDGSEASEEEPSWSTDSEATMDYQEESDPDWYVFPEVRTPSPMPIPVHLGTWPYQFPGEDSLSEMERWLNQQGLTSDGESHLSPSEDEV